jgi:hypothetical protein
MLAGLGAAALVPPAAAQTITQPFPGFQWDTVGGIPAPYISKGSLDIANWFLANGGALGDMSGTPSQRATNGAVLQNAINLAITDGKAIEFFPSARIEINNAAGITIPWSQSGFVWRGSSGAKSGIVQFATNAPILIIGDITGSANLGGQASIDGIYIAYGVSQTGNTGALALQLGAWASSGFRNIKVDKFGPAGTFPAYVPWTEVNASFSSKFENLNIQGGQQSVMRLTQSGATSGNVYSNVFCTCGNLNAPVALSSYAVGWPNAGITNSIFEQLNIEAVSANTIINCPGARGVVFADTHMETISLTGAGPTVFAGASSSMSILGCTLDFRCTTADGTTFWGVFVGTFGEDNVVMEDIVLLSNSSDSGAVNLPFYLTTTGAPLADAPQSVTLRGLKVSDNNSGGLANNVALDQNMPLANFASPDTVAEYRFGFNISRTFGAIRRVSASYTHYGSDIDATLLVPAALGATVTITLSTASKASGQGSTTPPPHGDTVRVRRQAGSFANNLLVVNGGPGGGTLWANSAAAAENQFTFNGTNWVLSS